MCIFEFARGVQRWLRSLCKSGNPVSSLHEPKTSPQGLGWAGFLNDLYSFNTKTFAWTQLVPQEGNNAPDHRMAMGFTAAADGYLYVFGGYSGNMPRFL
jgi:hypothetical protein